MKRWLCLALVLCIAEPTGAEAPMTPRERAARLIARGDQLRARGDTVSASAFYRDAIAAAPREVSGYLALGKGYADVGELSQAVEVFQVAMRYAGEHTDLLIAWIAAYEQNGAPREALELARSFAFAHPGEPRLASEHARLCIALGRFAEALSARRAQVARLRGEQDPEGLGSARTQVRALELLVGSSDRVRSPAVCSALESPVRRALAHCE